MPVVPLDATSGLSSEFSRVLSVMLFPRSRQDVERVQWLSLVAGEACASGGNKEATAEDLARLIPDIMAAKRAPRDALESALGQSSRRGMVAGQILLCLLSCARHHHRHYGVERACLLVEQLFEKTRTGSGLKFTVSESFARKAWAGFKTVSHFWLAYGELTRPETRAAAPERLLERWATILMLGESFRVAGERARILDAERTWKLSEQGAEVEPADIPPLVPEALAILDHMFP